jgi:hypothetical protein
MKNQGLEALDFGHVSLEWLARERRKVDPGVRQAHHLRYKMLILPNLIFP